MSGLFRTCALVRFTMKIGKGCHSSVKSCSATLFLASEVMVSWPCGSMMVLALFGGLVLHAILRLRGVGRWRSGIGALLLLFNPVFFHLSLSFMTDVFALTFCLVAFFHMERFKLNGYSRTDGLLAMIFLAIAVLNRPTALVLPVERPFSRCSAA